MLESGSLKITTLSENTVGRGGVTAEWGLSILVEAGDRKILLDTGGGTALENAYGLSVDLSSIDTIVLSHSHADHTKGLSSVLGRIEGEVPVIAHPEVWDLKYGHNEKSDEYFFLGIPYRREFLESLGARFELSAEPRWITDDICTSGEEPMITQFETNPDWLYKRVDGDYVPDTIADDLSLFIQTDLGVVIILGCAHRGMINIIRHAQTVMQNDNIYMVVGGTHLISADKDRLDLTIKALEEIDVTWLGVSHCTGFKASSALSNAFPGKFFTNNTGNVIEFPYEIE